MFENNNKNRNEKVILGSNRKFGLIMGFFFFFLAFAPLFNHHQIRKWPIVFGLAFWGSALFFDKKLTWFHQKWLKFGIILKQITTPLILLILFFGVFTPIGIILKILKKDLISLKRFNKNAGDTNWISLEPRGTNFKEQF